jgi:uncharacterized protein YwgA
MTDREEIVFALVKAAAGGSITGKVRLQKLTYLLDQLGLNSGFRFEYHHYGPFSRDLVNAVEDAKAFGKIREEVGARASDCAPYSIFHANEGSPSQKAYGSLEKEKLRKLVTQLQWEDATVLELAATAHWLWKYERRADWRDEIVRRKGIKVQQGRLDRAVALLHQLDIAPSERKMHRIA